MSNSVLANEYLRELEAEASATRECLKEVPMDKPDWKPHDKSMPLGYLAILVADIPRWLQYMIETGVVDFQTYEQKDPKTADELVALFDTNMEATRRSFEKLSDDDLGKEFQLKNGEAVLWTIPLGEGISNTINHLVHHRGQLTVYLKLNDKPIPSIYGPSADVAGF